MMCYSKVLIILAILSKHAIVNWFQEVRMIILRGHRSILSINFLAPLFYSKDWKTRYVQNFILFFYYFVPEKDWILLCQHGQVESNPI